MIRARSRRIVLGFRLVDLTMRNTRRYGGYIVHMGMVLIFIGLAGAAFNRDVQKDMQIGSTVQIGPYSLLLQNFDQQTREELHRGTHGHRGFEAQSSGDDAVSGAAHFSGQSKSPARWWRFIRR